MANGNGIVFERLVVDGNAKWCTYGILATIAFADTVFFVVYGLEVELQHIHHLCSFLGQTVFFDKRQYSHLVGSQHRRQMQYHARVAAFELLLFVRSSHYREEHSIDTDRGLYHIRHVALVKFGVEVFDVFTRIFLVLRQVEVRAAVYPLHLFESKGHLELYIGSGIGVVCQLFVVVEAIFAVAKSERPVPTHTEMFPVVEPLHLLARTDKKLHLHLLELTHTEDKLPCHYLIAECLAYLCYTERYLHSARLLHVEEIDKNTLCRLGTEIDLGGSVGNRTYLGRKHKVKLTHISPILGPRYGTNHIVIDNDLFEFIEIIVVHSRSKALVQGIAFLGILHYTRIGAAIKVSVERITETFGSFIYLFCYLLVEFSQNIFYQHIGSITLFAVAVVDKRVVECVDVPRSLPRGRMHKYGSVYAYHIIVEAGHSLPPIGFYIVF